MNNIFKLVGVLLIVLLSHACQWNKQAYVDSKEVMQNFEMYKKFETSYSKRLNSSKTYLDSILYNLSIQERVLLSKEDDESIQKSDFLDQRDNYFKLKEEHSSALDIYYEEEMNKITVRLNEYFVEYGRDNNYSLILGAGGQGVLLYADTALNITSEFIVYANKRYSGND